jgi:hypothetical protein
VDADGHLRIGEARMSADVELRAKELIDAGIDIVVLVTVNHVWADGVLWCPVTLLWLRPQGPPT